MCDHPSIQGHLKTTKQQNKEKQKMTKTLRTIYVKDNQTSNPDKVKQIAFDGANPEECTLCLTYSARC